MIHIQHNAGLNRVAFITSFLHAVLQPLSRPKGALEANTRCLSARRSAVENCWSERLRVLAFLSAVWPGLPCQDLPISLPRFKVGALHFSSPSHFPPSSAPWLLSTISAISITYRDISGTHLGPIQDSSKRLDHAYFPSRLRKPSLRLGRHARPAVPRLICIYPRRA